MCWVLGLVAVTLKTEGLKQEHKAQNIHTARLVQHSNHFPICILTRIVGLAHSALQIF